MKFFEMSRDARIINKGFRVMELLDNSNSEEA